MPGTGKSERVPQIPTRRSVRLAENQRNVPEGTSRSRSASNSRARNSADNKSVRSKVRSPATPNFKTDVKTRIRGDKRRGQDSNDSIMSGPINPRPKVVRTSGKVKYEGVKTKPPTPPVMQRSKYSSSSSSSSSAESESLPDRNRQKTTEERPTSSAAQPTSTTPTENEYENWNGLESEQSG